MLRREGLICLGLIFFAPLICIGADITHKVGVQLMKTVTVKNIQNMSFGQLIIIPYNPVSYSVGVAGATDHLNNIEIISEGHPGIIKITGEGYVSIQSTPPSVLRNEKSETIPVFNMEIVNSDGSTISDMNNVELNGELELKTIGELIGVSNLVYNQRYGEFTADWPITVDYVGSDGPE